MNNCDQLYRDCLKARARYITNGADAMVNDARELLHYVGLTETRPDFETLAEEAMETAERSLIEALERIRRARSEYTEKPIEPAHVREQCPTMGGL